MSKKELTVDDLRAITDAVDAARLMDAIDRQLEDAKLKPCPLCHEPKDLQIDQLPGYRPEIVCNNCGIALQGEDVLDAITRWNKRTKEQANAE